MEISRSISNKNRFEIEGISEPKGKKIGIAGYHGGFWAIIGWIAAKILHKAVPIKTSKGIYYLNCKSLKNWYQRIAPSSVRAGWVKMHDPDAVRGMIESIIPAEGKKFILTVQDVHQLAKSYLGLRHTSTPEDAQREAQEGFSGGCSLNISPQNSKLEKMNQRSWRQIPIEEQEAFAKHFEKGIRKFIDQSLIFDLNGSLIMLNKTKIRDVAVVVNSCRFAIVDYGFNCACDHRLWGKGLGRYPKQSMSGDRITPIPPVKIEDLGYTERELNQVISSKQQGDALFDRLKNCYVNAFIQTVRPLVNPAVDM